MDCFYEGENMLVIHPDECIDCGVCEPECPAVAIVADTEPGLDKWLKLNAEYAKVWPNITIKRDPPARRQGLGRGAGKIPKFFSAEPARATSRPDYRLPSSGSTMIIACKAGRSVRGSSDKS